MGNETLREAFYTGDWSYNKCIQHRIFISQVSYPVKGFHTFIEALRDVSMFYPDVTVHVAGNDITKRDLIGGNSYGLYIRNQLEKYHLQKKVCFCGSLNEEQMKHEMLAANVFVSPSNIENSPNSVGEAMLLGVPVVSSAVGGVMDLLEHKTEGFVYQSDAPYMLAHFVMKVFENLDLSYKMGKRAQEHARVTHDYQKNMDRLVEIYNSIAKG
ncbi:D-inositol-3-phosphate glycosyltransferase [anaerobic digester metagenome]